MRHFFTIISAAAASIAALSSCARDFLETERTDTISSNIMWSNEEKADAGMAGIYRPLYKSDLSRTQIRMEDYDGLNRTGIEGYGFTSMIDQTNYPPQWLYRSGLQTNDFQIRLEWTTLYTVIHACNDAIAHVGNAGLAESKYQRYLCEATLLRAYCYSRLNMLYGGVPLYDKPITNEECVKSQASFRETWEFIINDCTFAIDNQYCPDNTLTGNYGRPSKGMAYALRGMAYMWLASDRAVEAAYPDETVTPLSDAQKREYYTLAEADFAAVSDCGYGLWQGEWGDFFTAANEKSREMIFPLQFNSDPGFCSNWQKVIGGDDNWIGWESLMPAQEFVDSYQWADGSDFVWTDVPGMEDYESLTVGQREVFFLRDSLEDVSAKIDQLDELLRQGAANVASGLWTSDENEAYSSSINVSKQYYVNLQTGRSNVISRVGQDIYDRYYINHGNEARLRRGFDNRDPRLDASVITPYKRVMTFDPRYSSSVVYKQPRWPLKGMDKYTDNADYWGCNRNSFWYVWKKYNILDDSLPGGSNGRERCDCDWPLIRFTQVQLQRAEALAHIGRTGEAKTLVDEVRARAGMPPTTASSENELIKAIQYEARVELCEEGVNFFDEIRWGTWREMKFQGSDRNGGRSPWGDPQYSFSWTYKEGMWPWSVSDWAAQKEKNLKRRNGWTY